MKSPSKLSLRALLAELPVLAFVFFVVVLLARAHWPYLRFPYQENVDEAYLLGVGHRMVQNHWLPFVDGVAHSGPLFLYSGALISALGQYSWAPIRWAAALGFVSIALLTFAVGRAAGRTLAGAIGAAAVPMFALFWLYSNDGIAYNAEVPLLVFALAALYAVLRASELRSARHAQAWTVLAGACLSCAVLCKQVGALLALPITLQLVLTVLHREKDRAARRKLLLAYVAAGAAPVVLILLWQAIHGGLHDLYYYVVVYNRDIYMLPFANESRLELYGKWLRERPMELTLIFTAVFWAAAQVLRHKTSSWLDAYVKSALPVTLAMLSIAGVIGARASMRDFGHYFLLAMPWVGLTAGWMLDANQPESEQPSLVASYRLVVLLPLVVMMVLCDSKRASRMNQWVSDHDRFPNQQYVPAMCQSLAAHMKPEDSVFIWGFRAEYYISCKRKPATRYVFSTFVAGYVPWDDSTTKEQEDQRAVPGSRATLIADLERERPRVILDTGDTTIRGRNMLRYDELRAYLQAHYRPAELIGAEQLYVRVD